MVDITVPITIQHPGRTVHSPFGDNEVPGATETLTVTIHIDDNATQQLKAALTDPPKSA